MMYNAFSRTAAWIAAFLLSAAGMAAQGTLQFNQARLIGSSLQTVPSGKVWKVESVLPSKAFTIDQPYSIEVNGSPVFVSEYNAGVKYWDNISSIQFDMRFRTESGSCTGSCGARLNFTYSGAESGLPFSNRSVTGSLITTSQTTYATQFTVTPASGSAISITSFRLHTTSNGSCHIPVKVRMTVNYTDGSTQVAEYDGGTCASNSTVDIIGNSTAPFAVQAASRDYFHASARFPFWLPAGTTLRTLNNVQFIPVLEFNVVP